MTTLAADMVNLGRCTGCGWPRWSARMCTCAHRSTTHDIDTRKGINVRTACSHTGPDGPCGCRMFEEVTADVQD